MKNIHKIINIAILILLLFGLWKVYADGFSPGVKVNMGCASSTTQPLVWDGNGNISCQNFPVPDWNSVSGNSQIINKPNIPTVQDYEGTTQRLNPILINKAATVAGSAGNAVYNFTNDGTSGGTALCQNGVMLNSPNLSVNDASSPYQFSWAWSNSNKTLTVLAQKASGLAVLTFTLLGIPSPVPNGTIVNATIICY